MEENRSTLTKDAATIEGWRNRRSKRKAGGHDPSGRDTAIPGNQGKAAQTGEVIGSDGAGG